MPNRRIWHHGLNAVCIEKVVGQFHEPRRYRRLLNPDALHFSGERFTILRNYWYNFCLNNRIDERDLRG